MNTHLDPDSPIGVFDSGIGGLTVARALRAALPNESILYFGDTARVPYGVKSPDTIRHFSTQITRFLLERHVKLLVIACNTMAAVAAEDIRSLSPVPVLDVIDAGARSAAATGRRIGVIGTLATVSSGAYEQALHAHASGLELHAQACPLFVPLVEEGWLDHPVTRLTAEEYLRPLLVHRIDTLVLGCTHYPLLKPLLSSVAGPAVTIIDSAETVAVCAAELLDGSGLRRMNPQPPPHRVFVTDVPQRFRAVAERFLDESLPEINFVTL
jgi:glutamate racemase